MKELYLYGYKTESPLFEGMSAGEGVDFLRARGISGVFGGYENREFVKAAHDGGLKVMASFKCFAGEEEWTDSPGSRPVLDTARPLDKIEWYAGLNPAYEPLRRKRLDAFSSFLTDHDVDGIWLDFIRWPCKWEKKEPRILKTSFDRATIEAFCRDKSIPFPGGAPESWASAILERHRDEWFSWRGEVIASWVKEARSILKARNQAIPLGIFMVPRIPELDKKPLIDSIGQDPALLAPLADVLSPMTYHTMCGRNVEWIGRATEYFASFGTPVYPIIQSVETDTYKEALEHCQTIKSADKIISFTLDGHFCK